MIVWMLFTLCGECGEPIPFDIINQMGYNAFGLNGHSFKSKEEAENALAQYRASSQPTINAYAIEVLINI